MIGLATAAAQVMRQAEIAAANAATYWEAATIVGDERPDLADALSQVALGYEQVREGAEALLVLLGDESGVD